MPKLLDEKQLNEISGGYYPNPDDPSTPDYPQPGLPGSWTDPVADIRGGFDTPPIVQTAIL